MVFNFKTKLLILLIVALLVNFTGCFYSFTGASVPAHLNSIAILTFEDRSGSGEAGLQEEFTNKQIEKFLNDNTLQVTERVNADAVLEGTILSVSDAPVAVSTEENVSTRQLTINVRVVFKDLVKKQTISDRKYSNYGQYNVNEDIVTARQAALSTAIDRITDDILLGTVSNW